MVKIRLKRIGANKNPHYRIVVTDARKARDGAYIEAIGNYDPRGVQTFALDETRLEYWLTKGAEMSPRVTALVRRSKKEFKTSGALPHAEEEASNPHADASLDTGGKTNAENESSEGGK